MNQQDVIEIITAAAEPLIEEIGDTADRVTALEKGTSKQAANDACENLVAAADAFRRDSMAVSELPHIAQALMVLRAYGRDPAFSLPEVQV